jgi:hypothetical protein
VARRDAKGAAASGAASLGLASSAPVLWQPRSMRTTVSGLAAVVSLVAFNPLVPQQALFNPTMRTLAPYRLLQHEAAVAAAAAAVAPDPLGGWAGGRAAGRGGAGAAAAAAWGASAAASATLRTPRSSLESAGGGGGGGGAPHDAGSLASRWLMGGSR